jgi:hypothetical protein
MILLLVKEKICFLLKVMEPSEWEVRGLRGLLPGMGSCIQKAWKRVAVGVGVPGGDYLLIDPLLSFFSQKSVRVCDT